MHGYWHLLKIVSLILLILGGATTGRYVGAMLFDSAAVGSNTFSTASVFAGVKQIHSGQSVSTGIGLVTETLLEPIDPSKSILFFNTRHNSTDSPDQLVRGRIKSSTEVEFGRVTTTNDTIEIQWYIIEYFSGVSVQRGEVFQSSTSVDVALPSPVSDLSQAFVMWSKTPGSGDTGFDADDPIIGELTTTSNLQFRTEAANSTHRIWWQVIEFTDPAEILVQSGTTALTGGQSIADIALPTGVDTGKAFALVGYTTDGSGNDIGARLLRARFLDGNNLRIDRSIIGDADDITEIHWQVVELNDGSTVQGGTETLAGGILNESVTISSVDLGRTVAFSPIQGAGAQSLGRTGYQGSTTLGVASAIFGFASDTQLVIERNNSDQGADFGYFVVEFADL